MPRIRIAGPGTNPVLKIRVAQRCEHRVIDLDVGATERLEPPDLFGVRLREIRKELALIRVERGIPETMQNARRGDADLRRDLCDPLQEREMITGRLPDRA